MESATQEKKPSLQTVTDIDAFLATSEMGGEEVEVNKTYDAFERVPPPLEATYIASINQPRDLSKLLHVGEVSKGDRVGQPWWKVNFVATLEAFADGSTPEELLQGRRRTFDLDAVSFLRDVAGGGKGNVMTSLLTMGGIDLPSPTTEKRIVDEFLRALRTGFKVLAVVEWKGGYKTGQKKTARDGREYDEYRTVFRSAKDFPVDSDGNPIPEATYTDGQGVEHDIYARAEIVRFYPING